MRSIVALLTLALGGCWAQHPTGDEYRAFAKRELSGSWWLSTEHGEGGEVRFVIDEPHLYAYASGAALDAVPIVAWGIDAHVAAEDDEACPGGVGCVLLEDRSMLHWYERSLVLVDWSRTIIVADTPAPMAPLELEPRDRLDPIARGERGSDGLRAFEVPARFEVLFGETELTLRFERSD